MVCCYLSNCVCLFAEFPKSLKASVPSRTNKYISMFKLLMYTFYLKEVCIVPKSQVLLSFHLFCICRYFILTCCFCVIISKNHGQSLPVAQWNINPALILENIWYHEESTIYNIINLWRHEQILLIMLRFKRYLAWDVISLNICSWRVNCLYWENWKDNYGFCKKNKFFFIEDISIHSFY